MDHKLSSMAAGPVASAVALQQPNFPPSIVPKPVAMINEAPTTRKHPPQVGKDPKLLACMNDSSSSHANLGVAASISLHQQQLNDNIAPPSKESIAALLSFKQTSPTTVATNGPPNTGIMANYRQMKPNPSDSLTNSNQFRADDHMSLTNVPSASTAQHCINNSNFWLQEEEERFL